MPTTLNYSSIAVASTLTQAVEATDTVLQIADTTGYPTAPFKLVVDKDRSAEEVMIVNTLSGNTANVLRGQDGTPASHHDVAAPVVHGFSASEFQDASDHVAASGDVHGVSGNLVGELSPQTLDRKTFRSTAGSAPPLVVQAQNGQSVNTQEWRSETGSVVASVAPSGRLATPGVDSSSSSNFSAGSAALVPVKIRMASGQTARPLQILDSGNAEIMAVSPSGQVICSSVQVTGGTALGTTTGTSLTLSGDLTAANVVDNGNLQVSGNASVSGTLTATNFSTSGALNVTSLTSSSQLIHRGSVPVPIMAAGSVTVTCTTSSFGQTSISFPAGRFTVAPIVMATLQGAPTGSGKYSARVINVTSSGALVQIYDGDSSANTFSVVVGWVAVQMTTTTADG